MKRSSAALLFGIVCGFIFLIAFYIGLDIKKDLLILISLFFSLTAFAILLMHISGKKNKPK